MRCIHRAQAIMAVSPTRWSGGTISTPSATPSGATGVVRTTMTVWIDSRESAAVRGSLGTQLQDVDYTALTTGDFALWDDDGCSLGIERKTVADLLGSMADKRLERQMSRMIETYTVPILLVEGWIGRSRGKVSVGSRATGWHWGAVQMCILSLELMGIKFMNVPDLAATGEVLRLLHQRAEKGCLREGHYARQGSG